MTLLLNPVMVSMHTDYDDDELVLVIVNKRKVKEEEEEFFFRNVGKKKVSKDELV